MQKPFVPTLQNRTKSVNIRFEPSFNEAAWPQFQGFSQECLKGGYMDWTLDFCEMNFLNSMLMGLVIELNAKVLAKGGKLSITTKRGSKIAQLLMLSKLNRIISIYQV